MRLFLAINLPDELKKGISQRGRDLSKFGKFKLVEEENIHLTLKFLGEVEEKNVSEIVNTLKQINLEKFKIGIRGVGVFPNPNFIKVVWVGVEEGSNEVIEIQKKIDDALKKLGFPKDKKFHHHATIARAKFVKDKKGLLDFLEKNKAREFGSFETSSFDLMESKLSREGPEYRVVEIFQ